MTQIKRIQYMEQLLDQSEKIIQEFSDALDAYQKIQDTIQELSDYYTGADWREDYEADCAGKLPQNLKRGVLSEDAVYNLLAENEWLKKQLAAYGISDKALQISDQLVDRQPPD